MLDYTLAQVWSEYRNRRHLKPATAIHYEKTLTGCVPDWWHVRLSVISLDMIDNRHVELSQHAPARANLTMRILRAIFAYAIAKHEVQTGVRALNPVAQLSKLQSWNPTPKRTRHVSPEQMPHVMRALQNQPDSSAAQCLMLLFFTGLRIGEAARLRWVDINLEGRSLSVLDTKNGHPHTLPLSDFLVAFLTVRQRTTASKYVFPGASPETHFCYQTDFTKYTAPSGIRFSPHDCRRTFATTADAIGVQRHIIKRLLNHRSGDVTDGYIISSVEPLREPMQRITDELLRQSKTPKLCKEAARAEGGGRFDAPAGSQLLTALLFAQDWYSENHTNWDYSLVHPDMRRLMLATGCVTVETYASRLGCAPSDLWSALTMSPEFQEFLQTLSQLCRLFNATEEWVLENWDEVWCALHSCATS